MRGWFAMGLVLTTTMLSAADGPTEKVTLGDPTLTSGIPGKGPLKLEDVKKWVADPKNHVKLDPQLPAGLAAGQLQMKGLDKNPLTRAKIELGRQLYFDTRLSSDNTISCASCHHPEDGYGRATQFGVGVRGQTGDRNSPVSYNRILSDLQFWDGRADSLEDQAKGPIANPIEMANTHDACLTTINKIPAYQVQFEAVFGVKKANIDNVAHAIAAFERALVTGPSPFDFEEQLKPFAKLSKDDLEELKEDSPEAFKRYEAAVKGAKDKPMSDSAKRGMALYFSERVNCAACHVGANLTDEKYHNIGVGMDKPKPDLGRYNVTKKDEDWGAFKTPTVRNVEFSAPYMHDGSQKTLLEVVEHYAKGGIPNKNLSSKIKKIDLTQQEKLDLVEFMKACSGEFPKVETARLPE